MINAKDHKPIPFATLYSRYSSLWVGYPSLFNGYFFRDKSRDTWKVNRESNPGMYLTVKYFYH